MSAVKSIRLEVAGLGMIFYSPFSAASIAEGEDYLEKCFSDPDFVEKQAVEGKLVGVSTGTSGIFPLEVFWGYPPESIDKQYDRSLRLGVEVRDQKLCIRDLYDLIRWESQCPPEQIIELADGFYHITLLTRDPPSGILGDNQEILVYLQKLPQMPKLRYNGVPTLIW
jgi:hypothetical protein